MPITLNAQNVQNETRAVWLTTVDNLDWPLEREIGNADAQKKSLIQILDNLQRMNFNTIYFQVRPRGNAFYNSSYEPWAKELSGSFGTNPGWDPLKLITEEANKRGMEVHAWINIVKVWSSKSAPNAAEKKHILKSNSKLCKLYDNEWWLDLGYPEARDYTLKIIKDILTNYNIDGLHFDYLRYPGKDFNDKDSYAIYGKNSNKDDWRRNNINLFLKDVKELVSSTKPYIKIGAAPIGIYKNVPGVNGWSSYESLYQDTKYWLDNNLVDYIAPQTYWDTKLSKKDPAFGAVVAEWKNINSIKNIFPGIGLWKKSIADEVVQQIEICKNSGMKGFSIYRYSNILNNTTLRNLFKAPVIIPKAINHVDNFNGNDITLIYDLSTNTLKWNPSRDDIKFYNIYKISNGEKILVKILGRNIKSQQLNSNESGNNYCVTFTTLYDNESPVYYPTKSAITEKKPDIVNDKAEINNSVKKKSDIDLKELFGQNIYMACYPNLFKEYLLIGYEINQKLPVEVSIKTLSGKEVMTLLKGIQNQGKYVLKADGSDFEKGKYICTLRAGDIIKQKIIIKK